jgi:hypothetical protein
MLVPETLKFALWRSVSDAVKSKCDVRYCGTCAAIHRFQSQEISCPGGVPGELFRGNGIVPISAIVPYYRRSNLTKSHLVWYQTLGDD